MRNQQSFSNPDTSSLVTSQYSKNIIHVEEDVSFDEWLCTTQTVFNKVAPREPWTIGSQTEGPITTPTGITILRSCQVPIPQTNL